MIPNNSQTVNGFSSNLWQQLEEEIRKIKKEHTGPYIAAFDADGTLWDTDVSDLFREHLYSSVFNDEEKIQIDASFARVLKESSEKIDLWFAEALSKGAKIEDVKKWADESWKILKPFPFFEDQKKLVHLLKENDFEVYVVSASFQPTVVAPALEMGFKKENIIGVEVETQDGVYQGKTLKPCSIGPGKVEALLAKTNGLKPAFCAGNTTNDFALLESSQFTRLAIQSNAKDELQKESELNLQELAKERNWLSHSFNCGS